MQVDGGGIADFKSGTARSATASRVFFMPVACNRKSSYHAFHVTAKFRG